MDTYRKGDRVQVTGKGRTANWPRYLRGTVMGKYRAVVYVQWDHAAFTLDEMERDEIKKVSHVS
jgi:DNA replicative helicase MCM subunit Mcm2 (Cdc46/Mcm family)